jgi:ubiquinol-cytochrome c reductase cytochrome c1 subunit
MNKLIALLFALLASGDCLAVGVGFPLEPANTNVGDRASLQRGARLFVNYCGGCHSLTYLRYSRLAEDLGLTEKQVMDNLNFTGGKFGEPINASLAPADAIAWFGIAPPDLSLTARAKPGGPDWIYTYLKTFYVDDSRLAGWNNPVLPNAGMPHALWELQGIQRVVTEPHAKDAAGNELPCHKGDIGTECLVKFELVQPGRLDAEAYDGVARDIATFLDYAAEPAALQRAAYGPWVLLFLAFFTFIAWLLKVEFWRDVE